MANLAQYAVSKHLSLDEIADVIAFSRDDILEDILNSPFTLKTALGNKFGWATRYSTGEWPVFYGALTRETAEREVAFHYDRNAEPVGGTRPTVTYTLVWCLFKGTVIDLRTRLDEWPELTGEDYAFCNSLGSEAHQTGLEGFLAPSARHDGGTNLPTFTAAALSEPQIAGFVRFTSGLAGPTLEQREESSELSTD